MESVNGPLRTGLSSSVLALVVVLGPTRARAQSYRTFTYSDVDGLPSPEVLDVAQGADGRIWVVTGAGVATFDGVEWEVPASCELEHPAFVAAGPDRGVFIVSQRRPEGVVGYRAGRWSAFGPAGAGPVEPTDVAVVPGEGGATLVCGTANSGLWLRGTTAARDAPWRRLGVGDGLPSDVVHGLDVTADRVIAATARGVALVDATGVRATIPGPERSPAVLAVARDPYSDPPCTWAHGHDWIGRIVDGRLSELEVRPPSEPARAENLELRAVPDGFGGVCISYFVKLTSFDPTTSTFSELGSQQGISGGGAFALLLDRDRNVWIGNARGLTRLPPRRFANYDRRHGLLEDEVSAVVELPSGELVLGHPSGLSFLDLEEERVERLTLTETIGANVLEIEPDGDDELLVALNFDGLVRVSVPGRRIVERYPSGRQRRVMSVERDRDGRLWIGSPDGLFRGLEQLEGAPLIEAEVRRVVASPDGRVAAATDDDGVWFVDAGEAWAATSDDEPNANSVFAVHFSDPILVGTRVGLFRVEGRRLVRQEGRQRIDAAVYFITEGPDGHLWFGTRRGLWRWTGQRLRHYTVHDGLAGQEANRAAGVFDSAGRLWVGTSSGVSLYRGRYDVPEPGGIRVGLSSIEADGRELPLDRPVELGYESDLVFGFRAVSFVGSGRPEYRCRLDGFDDAWLGPGQLVNGRVRYTNLPAGSYRLRVQARHVSGPWGPTASSPGILVTAPFWQRGWFYVVVALAGGLAVFLVTSLTRAWRQSAELERLAAERGAELVELEERYTEVFTRTRAAQVLVEASSGRILDINPAAEEWIGSSADCRGRSFADVVGVDHDSLEAALLATETSSRFVVSGSAPERDYEISACRYDLRGKAVVHAIIFDVTEQRRLQDQLQQDTKLKAIGQLAGGVAHDFNNLLTLILGYSDIVLKHSREPETRTEVERIREAGRRGAGLVGQLLAFSRHQVLSVEVLDLNAILPATVDMLQRMVGEAHPIRLQRASGELCVRADRNQIDRVLVNLAVNARDALPQGGEIVVAVGVGRPPGVEFDATEYATLTVADRGTGMSAEVRERVLEPFFTTKGVGEGTGLGLPTVYGIVRQSEGELVVESAPGEGTTVTVFLPRVSERPGSEVVDPLPVRSTGQGWTILYVEDDASVRRMCVSLLKAAGHDVIEACDGEDALRLAAGDASFDLLLTDIVMPRMGGRELAWRLRAERPDLRVLFVSGYSEEDLEVETGETTCSFLQKPFTPSELREAIARLQRPAARSS